MSRLAGILSLLVPIAIVALICGMGHARHRRRQRMHRPRRPARVQHSTLVRRGLRARRKGDPTMTDRTEKRNPLGPIGENVRTNIQRIRTRRKITYKELSDMLAAVGRPIPTLGLSRLENGERRVDVDDLVALSKVFGTSPAILMSEFRPSPEYLDTCEACILAFPSHGHWISPMSAAMNHGPHT